MKGFLYSVYDKPAASYSEPIVVEKDAVALRMFQQKLKDSPIAEDFCLMKVGSFDSDNLEYPINTFRPVEVKAHIEMEVQE